MQPEKKKEDGPTLGLLATLTYSGERRPDADLADHPGEDGYRIHLTSRSLAPGAESVCATPSDRSAPRSADLRFQRFSIYPTKKKDCGARHYNNGGIGHRGEPIPIAIHKRARPSDIDNPE